MYSVLKVILKTSPMFSVLLYYYLISAGHSQLAMTRTTNNSNVLFNSLNLTVIFKVVLFAFKSFRYCTSCLLYLW